LILLCLTASACDEPSPTAPTAAELANLTWRLRSIQRADGTTVAVTAPDRYTLQFGDGGRLSVRADCNTCGGGYRLNGAEFLAGPLACTRAFCGPDSLDTEYLRVFDSTASMVTADGALFVSRAGVRLTFRP
jgi:heat shock protein HslJ